jgi:hypothetical protein
MHFQPQTLIEARDISRPKGSLGGKLRDSYIFLEGTEFR